MTPDEVVEAFNLELNRLKGYLEIPEMEIHYGERMRKMVEALHLSISLLQDYQKLRGKIDAAKICEIIQTTSYRPGHMPTTLSQALVTYLGGG